MNLWILIWKVFFLIGLFLFIAMFLFISVKGFFEILDLLKRDKIK